MAREWGRPVVGLATLDVNYLVDVRLIEHVGRLLNVGRHLYAFDSDHQDRA